MAGDIRLLGKLMATAATANKVADDYINRLNRIGKQNSSKSRVSVFYQVWDRPLLTVNGEHLISHVISLCGGENVFADIKTFVPQVNVESVLEKNPQAIIVGMNEERKEWLVEWQQWTGLQAVQNKHVYPINADLIVRHTPRILLGAEILCQHFDDVRNSQ